MRTLTPFLWYDGTAEQAAALYCAVFDDAAVTETRRTPDGAGSAAGTVMAVTLRIAGRDHILFNGGPHFAFTPAFSLFVECEDQSEIDRTWDGLTAGGGAGSRCGWCRDPFGLSWQIVPRRLGAYLADPDRSRAAAVMQALMTMGRIDCAALDRAHADLPA